MPCSSFLSKHGHPNMFLKYALKVFGYRKNSINTYPIFNDGLVNTNMTSVNNFLMIRLWYIYINVRKCIPHTINDW
jgi:hypothetical protein